MSSSAYFAKRVSWADGNNESDPVEAEYLIGGRTRGIEGHLKGGGSGNSKSHGFVDFFTHLSFLGILVISALLINSFVNSVHHEAYEILSIVGVVLSCLVCVTALLSLCGLYQFDAHNNHLLLMGHLLSWAMLLMQISYGGLVTAYWGARAMPDILMTSPDASPIIFLDTATTTTTATLGGTSLVSLPPIVETNDDAVSPASIITLQHGALDLELISLLDKGDNNKKGASSTLLLTRQTLASPSNSDATHAVASRPLIGILTISAVVTMALCVVGLSAVNWPSITQLRVIKINITLCALILLGIALAVETLDIWTLVDPPAALGITFDDVSAWSVYGALVSAFFTLILAILLVRLLCIVGKEQELNVPHTHLSRRSAATSSSSTFAPMPVTASSSSGLGSGVRTSVGIVSTRAEHNAVKHQRTLSSLHTVMFLSVFVTAAIVTFSVFTYNSTLPSIDEQPRSQLLLASSILGFASPVFNFLTFVTCYQWRRRILDSNDSDIYSKHSHKYEPFV